MPRNLLRETSAPQSGPRNLLKELSERPTLTFQEEPVAPPERGIVSEFTEGVKAGIEQTKGLGYGLAGVVGEAAGIEPLKEWGIEGYKEKMAEAAKHEATIPSFEKIESIADVPKYLAHGLGTVVPTVATAAATGVIGGTLVKAGIKEAVKRGLAKELTKEAAKKAVERGAIGGMAAGTIGMETGGIYGEQAEKGVTSPGAAVVGGVAAGALDVIPLVRLGRLTGIFTGKATKEVAGKVQDGLIKRIATEGVKQFGIEGLTEGTQTVIEKAAVKYANPETSLTDKEALKDYINSALIGGAAGFFMGGVGGAFKTQPETVKPPLEEKEETPPTETVIPPPPSTIQRPGILERAAGILSEIPAEEAIRRETEAETFAKARGLEPMIPSIADLGMKGFGYGEVIPEKKGEVKPQPKEAPVLGYGGEIYKGPEAPIDLVEEVWSVLSKNAATPLPKGAVETMMKEQADKDKLARVRAIAESPMTQVEKQSMYEDIFTIPKQYRATPKPEFMEGRYDKEDIAGIPGGITPREAVEQAEPVEEGGRGEVGGGREVQAHERDIVRPAEAEEISKEVMPSAEEARKEGGKEGREVAPTPSVEKEPSIAAAPMLPTDVVTKAGTPYPSEQNAKDSAKMKKLDTKGYVPVQVEGGWVLRKTDRVADAGKPIEAAPVKGEAKAKEPWEMTKKEYAASGNELSEAYHFNGIVVALREGKPVPPEVLKDYPELQAKPKVEKAGKNISNLEADLKVRDIPEKFHMTIEGKEYTERTEAGERIIKIAEENKDSKILKKIGKYAGFDLFIQPSFLNPAIMAKGKAEHSGNISESSTGTIQSLDRVIRTIEVSIDKNKDMVNDWKNKLIGLKAEAAKPFQYDAKLKELTKKQDELIKKLDLDKSEMTEGLEEGEGKEPSTVSLGSGFGALQDSYEALEKITIAKIKDAIPHLENIGNSVYKAGMKYADFAKAMKTALGDLWDKFRSQMIRVYQSIKAKFKEERGSIPALSRAEGKGPGLKVSKIKSTLAPILKNWKNKPTVNVVKTLSDIPQHLQDRMKRESGELGAIEGMFDPKDRSIYLVADNIESTDRAIEVLFHESLGHYGLRGLMGENIKPLLNIVWREKNAEARKIAKEYELDINAEGIDGYNARQTAAEEVLARMAQEDVTPPLLKRILSAIRNWMRKVGFDITLTDEDLKKIVYDAARYVRTGEKPLSLTGEMPAFSRKTEATEGSKLATKIEADRASGNFATEEELKAEGYSEQEEEAYRKLTEEDDNIDMSGHLLAKDKKEIWADAKKTVDRAIGIISTRLGNIHPRIKAIFREHQRDLAKAIAEDHIAAKPFIAKFKKLPKKIRIALSNALLDGRAEDADIIAKRHGLLAEMKIARRIFDTTRNRAIEAGLEVGKIDNYWARVVKNPKKLLAAIRGTEEWSGIDAAIKRIEKEKGPLSEVEKSIIIDQVLRGYPANTISLTSTSHLKERKFKQIPKKYLEYYMPANQSLLSYITSMNNTIEAAKFFGKSKKPRYNEFIAGVRKEAGEAAREENRRTGKMSREDYWDAYNKHVSNAIKEAKLEADINPEIVTEAGLDDSIGSLINDLMNKGLLDPAKEQDVRDMAQAVFRPARTGYGVQAYKNLTYLQLLAQFIPAITQIQDIALSAEKAGYWNTLKVVGKVVSGKADITIKDVHIENLMTEIDEGQDKLAKALEWSLRKTGFIWMDRIGKETLLSASMLKFQKQAQANDPKLRKQVEMIFEEHNPEQVMKDLAAGVKNDDTLFMLFNELSDQQPITVLEVPEKYLTAKGIGKTFYALKTFQLKLFDVYRRDVWNEYKNGNKAEAIRKLFFLTSALILMGVGTDEIKDFILGREADWDDRAWDNGLKLIGLSKYTIYKAKKEGLGEALLAQFAPPMGIINPLAKDVDEFLRKGELERGARSTANVPIAGKMYYWWLGRGAEQKAEERESREKQEKIRTRLGEAGYKRYQEQEKRQSRIRQLKSDRTRALNRATTSEEKRRIVVKYREKLIEARGQ